MKENDRKPSPDSPFNPFRGHKVVVFEGVEPGGVLSVRDKAVESYRQEPSALQGRAGMGTEVACAPGYQDGVDVASQSWGTSALYPKLAKEPERRVRDDVVWDGIIGAVDELGKWTSLRCRP